jgi:hypothetical protein
VGKTERGKGKGGDEADRGSHLVVKQEERWVVDGSAGCVGPKCMVGYGLGVPEDFGVL